MKSEWSSNGRKQNKLLAVKVTRPFRDEIEQTMQSIVHHSKMNHPNVIRLLGACEYDREIYRVMPMLSIK